MIKRRSMILGAIASLFTPVVAKVAIAKAPSKDVLRDVIKDALRIINEQNRAKTEEMLQSWANDKPHFELVRKRMAILLEQGWKRAAESKTDVKFDLDATYSYACWSSPDIRATLLSEGV